MLGIGNSSQVDEFFTIRRNEALEVYYISQNCFGLPRRSIRNKSPRKGLFKQSLRDVESMYKDLGGYDIAYYLFKDMCHETWSERFNYLCIEVIKNKIEAKYRIFCENKNTYNDCTPETKAL